MIKSEIDDSKRIFIAQNKDFATVELTDDFHKVNKCMEDRHYVN